VPSIVVASPGTWCHRPAREPTDLSLIGCTSLLAELGIPRTQAGRAGSGPVGHSTRLRAQARPFHRHPPYAVVYSVTSATVPGHWGWARRCPGGPRPAPSRAETTPPPPRPAAAGSGATRPGPEAQDGLGPCVGACAGRRACTDRPRCRRSHSGHVRCAGSPERVARATRRPSSRFAPRAALGPGLPARESPRIPSSPGTRTVRWSAGACRSALPGPGLPRRGPPGNSIRHPGAAGAGPPGVGVVGSSDVSRSASSVGVTRATYQEQMDRRRQAPACGPAPVSAARAAVRSCRGQSSCAWIAGGSVRRPGPAGMGPPGVGVEGSSDVSRSACYVGAARATDQVLYHRRQAPVSGPAQVVAARSGAFLPGSVKPRVDRRGLRVSGVSGQYPDERQRPPCQPGRAGEARTRMGG